MQSLKGRGKKMMSDIIQIKFFCSQGDTAKRIQRQANMFKTYIQWSTCAQNIQSIYKVLLKLNNKETNNSM